MIRFLASVLLILFSVSACSDESIESIHEKADSGDAIAQYKLGYIYRWKMENVDYDKARYWFTKAAEQGNANAQVELGGIYQSGLGVSVDNQKALDLYRKAAEKNNADALASLGYMYETGTGIEKDDAQALKYYQRAAELGNKFAKMQVFMLKNQKK